MYSPINTTPKFMNRNLKKLKRKIDNSIVIVGEFNSLLPIMDKITRQKINKEREHLNNTTNHFDKIYM